MKEKKEGNKIPEEEIFNPLKIIKPDLFPNSNFKTFGYKYGNKQIWPAQEGIIFKSAQKPQKENKGLGPGMKSNINSGKRQSKNEKLKKDKENEF